MRQAVERQAAIAKERRKGLLRPGTTAHRRPHEAKERKAPKVFSSPHWWWSVIHRRSNTRPRISS